MKPEELEYFARQCRHKNLNPQPVLDHIAALESSIPTPDMEKVKPADAAKIHFDESIAPQGEPQ